MPLFPWKLNLSTELLLGSFLAFIVKFPPDHIFWHFFKLSSNLEVPWFFAFYCFQSTLLQSPKLSSFLPWMLFVNRCCLSNIPAHVQSFSTSSSLTGVFPQHWKSGAVAWGCTLCSEHHAAGVAAGGSTGTTDMVQARVRRCHGQEWLWIACSSYCFI